MPYIPHTRSDVELMLEAIGVDDIEALFDEIPGELSEERSSALSSGLSELEMMLRMQEEHLETKEICVSLELAVMTIIFQQPSGT